MSLCSSCTILTCIVLLRAFEISVSLPVHCIPQLFRTRHLCIDRLVRQIMSSFSEALFRCPGTNLYGNPPRMATVAQHVTLHTRMSDVWGLAHSCRNLISQDDSKELSSKLVRVGRTSSRMLLDKVHQVFSQLLALCVHQNHPTARRGTTFSGCRPTSLCADHGN